LGERVSDNTEMRHLRNPDFDVTIGSFRQEGREASKKNPNLRDLPPAGAGVKLHCSLKANVDGGMPPKTAVEQAKQRAPGNMTWQAKRHHRMFLL